MARAAAAVNDIQFSVSVRGIHWMTTEDVIAHALGAHKKCKVHSIKIAPPPVQHRFATKAAFINYSSGDKASILALDGSSPEWNNSACITIREQDINIARKAAAKPITAALVQQEPASTPVLVSKKRKQGLTITGEGLEEEEDENDELAAVPSETAKGDCSVLCAWHGVAIDIAQTNLN